MTVKIAVNKLDKALLALNSLLFAVIVIFAYKYAVHFFKMLNFNGTTLGAQESINIAVIWSGMKNFDLIPPTINSGGVIYTPLFFIAGYLWTKLTGIYTYVALRIFSNLIPFIISIFFVERIGRKLNVKYLSLTFCAFFFSFFYIRQWLDAITMEMWLLCFCFIYTYYLVTEQHTKLIIATVIGIFIKQNFIFFLLLLPAYAILIDKKFWRTFTITLFAIVIFIILLTLYFGKGFWIVAFSGLVGGHFMNGYAGDIIRVKYSLKFLPLFILISVVTPLFLLSRFCDYKKFKTAIHLKGTKLIQKLPQLALCFDKTYFYLTSVASAIFVLCVSQCFKIGGGIASFMIGFAFCSLYFALLLHLKYQYKMKITFCILLFTFCLAPEKKQYFKGFTPPTDIIDYNNIYEEIASNFNNIYNSALPDIAAKYSGEISLNTFIMWEYRLNPAAIIINKEYDVVMLGGYKHWYIWPESIQKELTKNHVYIADIILSENLMINHPYTEKIYVKTDKKDEFLKFAQNARYKNMLSLKK